MALLKLLVLAALVFSPAAAHIHSQKVARIDKDKVSLETWTLALLSAAAVAAAGIFPLLLNRFIRLDGEKNSLPLRAVLSFAVGGLLGDVFLHLLPEAWGPASGAPGDWWIGVWVLLGLISFLLVEKLSSCTESPERPIENTVSSPAAVEGCSSNKMNGGLVHRNDHAVTAVAPAPVVVPTPEGIDVRGYLNLVANCTDNFTHGLAIAASYVAGPAVGMLTTLAILCHEIPHEVGDFAILLSSGFDKWSAAKAQAITATGGLIGVVAGLTAEHLSSTSSWLLPFTAGGFLYIALVSIVPQLLETSTGLWSIVEVAAMVLGVVVMAMVSMVERESCRHLPLSMAS